jgi:hypothetical protein
VHGKLVFCRIAALPHCRIAALPDAPDTGELEQLIQPVSRGVGRRLQRQGLLAQDAQGVHDSHRPPAVAASRRSLN